MGYFSNIYYTRWQQEFVMWLNHQSQLVFTLNIMCLIITPAELVKEITQKFFVSG